MVHIRKYIFLLMATFMPLNLAPQSNPSANYRNAPAEDATRIVSFEDDIHLLSDFQENDCFRKELEVEVKDWRLDVSTTLGKYTSERRGTTFDMQVLDPRLSLKINAVPNDILIRVLFADQIPNPNEQSLLKQYATRFSCWTKRMLVMACAKTIGKMSKSDVCFNSPITGESIACTDIIFDAIAQQEMGTLKTNARTTGWFTSEITLSLA